MKRNTDKVIEAFRDEFMSREAAACPEDWQAGVMRCIAGCTLKVTPPVLNNFALLWPLAWSAAAVAVIVVSTVLFLDPAIASSTSQLIGEIGTAQQIVASL